MRCGFVVVSGHFKQGDEGYEENIKYISECFTDVHDAVREWKINKSYLVNRIEVMDVWGKIVGEFKPHEN